ncbi:carboxypeptidase regulatory-like domain-containing protein, partial [Salinispira pacifica]
AAVHDAPAGSVLALALVEDGLAQTPDAGENRGRHLTHDGVVRWYGDAPIGSSRIEITVPVPADVVPSRSRLIAFVQDPVSLAVSGATAIALPATLSTATLSGRLVTQDGAALSGVSVQVCSDQICLLGLTDSAGRFTVKNIPAGSYELKLPASSSDGGYRAIPVTLKAGERLDLADVTAGEGR